MQHIRPAHLTDRLPLYGAQATRQIEQAAMAQLPAHRLMETAATAVYRLGRALYPHARRIWVACGPGNNGGDGLLAAAAWQRELGPCGVEVCVTWLGDEDRLPTDARHALNEARLAGVRFEAQPPASFDLAVDALLGMGANSRTQGRMAAWTAQLQATLAPVLCVDLPSGLNPDTGHWFNDCPNTPSGPRHTLALLSLKPGLFTASGRAAAGDIWLDELDGTQAIRPSVAPTAWLLAERSSTGHRQQRHDLHKGSLGDLLVLGGQDVRYNGQGMTGAALLAARAGLRAGAGRVYVGLLGTAEPPSVSVDTLYPELMFRTPNALLHPEVLQNATTVCGCGGGQAVREILSTVLTHSARLVLDADALNAVAESPVGQVLLAQRAEHGQTTVITPHPLEAARLLATTAATVQADRLRAAQQLADKFHCVVVLKGSGSVLAAPAQTPHINPTGNALLATAGTGDVLAGMLGAYWAANAAQATDNHANLDGAAAWLASGLAVYQHGLVADQWPTSQAFTASSLLHFIGP